MADTKITDLTAGTSVHTDDLLVFVDTHDTTMAATGTDKRVTPALLLAGMGLVPTGQLPALSASGPAHAAGLAPDPGPTAGSTRFLREDATWAAPPGSSGAGPVGLVYSQTGPVTVASPSQASLASATGAIGGLSLPAGFLDTAGRALRVRAGGSLTTGGSNGGATWSLTLGGAIIGTTRATPQGTNHSNYAWSFDAMVVIATTGASGTLNVVGLVMTSALQAYVVANAADEITQTPQVPVPVDTTAALTLDLVTTSTGTGNSVSLTTLTLEVLG